jgi:ribosomal protein S18 acetylase RimI-like enzyme
MILIVIIIVSIVLLLFNNIGGKTIAPIKTEKVNTSIHPDLVNTCFSEIEIDSFKGYDFSKVIYGKDKKSVCYLTPTNVLNEIPIISWNGYYINNFCVDMEYRRKGHGTSLLNEVINIARNEQKDHLILQVDDNNNSAKQLYYKMGFIEFFKGSDKNNNIKLFLVKYL